MLTSMLSIASFRRSLHSVRYFSSASASKGVEVISPLIGLSEDQAQYYALARGFADKEMKPHAAKWDEDGVFPLDVYTKCADLGFAGIFVKDRYGGSNLTRLDSTIIVEGLATGCVGTTAMLTIHNMCAGMIEKFGNEEQKLKYLPKLCSLELKASYCLTEPGSGSDAASLSTYAEFDSSSNTFILNGSKAFISGAGMSDVYLIMCRTDKINLPGAVGPISCFIVHNNTPGLSFGANEKKLGWKVQPTRQVILDNVRIQKEQMLGNLGQGFKMAMAGLDGGRLNIGACSLGAAQASMEIALSYTKERKQFGQSIASYQATQFKFADMAGKLLSARLALRHAASLLDAGHPAATAHCALAKKIATDNGFEIINEALQMHGGYGYLKDYHIERYLRDSRVHQILEGTNEIMRHIVGRALVA